MFKYVVVCWYITMLVFNSMYWLIALGRIRTDHNGITFSPVLQGDAGMYMAYSRNLAGSANAFAALRGEFYLKSYQLSQNRT